MLILDDLKLKLHSYFSQKFISQLQRNFEEIYLAYYNFDKEFKNHLTTDSSAHTSSQIDHTTKKGNKVKLSDHENYQNELIERLVLGHNGDGIQ